MFLDPIPGEQTNNEGIRYFGPKVTQVVLRVPIRVNTISFLGFYMLSREDEDKRVINSPYRPSPILHVFLSSRPSCSKAR